MVGLERKKTNIANMAPGTSEVDSGVCVQTEDILTDHSTRPETEKKTVSSDLSTNSLPKSSQLDEFLENNLKFIKSILNLKSILNEKDDVSKQEFANLLKYLSPKFDRKIIRKETKTKRFKFNPPWLGNTVTIKSVLQQTIKSSTSGITKVKVRKYSLCKTGNSSFDKNMPKSIYDVISLLTKPPAGKAKQNVPKTKIDGNSFKAEESSRQKKESPERRHLELSSRSFSKSTLTPTPKQNISTGAVSVIIRHSNCNELLIESVCRVLQQVEERINSNLIIQDVNFWQNSLMENCFKYLVRITESKEADLTKFVKSFVFRIIDGFEIELGKNQLVECRFKILYVFSESIELSFDIISHAIERLIIFQTNLESNVARIEGSYHVIKLLQFFVTKLTEKLMKGIESVGAEENEMEEESVINLWRKNWRRKEKIEISQNNEKKSKIKNVMKEWSVCLDDLIISFQSDFPIAMSSLYSTKVILDEFMDKWLF